MIFRCLLLAAIAALGACAATGTKPAEVPAAAATSALDGLQAYDRVFVAGQPTSADLALLKDRGITSVLNLRAPAEMAGIGFDEAAELAALGIDYQSHPVAGGKAFTAELLAAFAEQVAASDGKVLLHCASGARASLVYAAYAVKYRGLDIDTAMRTLEPFGGWPLPMERMIGEHLSVVRSAEVRHAGARSAPANTINGALGRSEFTTCPQ
ncbi:MAG: dual specificity protein phosphatase family protein [Rhodanobacteraceae bacterium]|nr:dual specificity protein phosphatase family protein [Rhodanobacteraceae bacterium]MBK7043559.1 dual specificity protein phosphatase family protein [Rhodanobacteraceae bacterium]MBP9154956.1 dual specificity protein phosphatase family protein [Xanthomonadales bacterium]HQW82430.1 sulfur transferase domain-containing protein [Pseudomonadota bacterium]